eukprot:CAMPEP_0170149818 /NCGR_PEP_ID=MMETSP0033_2-20121228/44262_1 /TAXON_ID=195969 /ORGANISM="Dolichomastix tenuilepis, Strain CCMP3274" /LENGTH=239 /DNA_ID=CAMNT_0010386803 /DNA_START=8 /DNA_END=724 /DNA_ORIENTATION=-
MTKEPKYVVVTNAKRKDRPLLPSWKAKAAGGNSVEMTDRTGQRYSCIIPPWESDDEASTSAAKGSERSASELLEALGTTCFYRVEGWWTYELCYKKHVRQFHQEQDKVVSEYVLGQFSAEASRLQAELVGQEFTEEPSASGAPTRYHSQVYTNGTACDLAGDEPRQTEVRFACVADSANLIASIKEPATCKYTLTFVTPLLCEHSAFKQQEQLVQHIQCEAFTPLGQETAEPEQGHEQE